MRIDAATLTPQQFVSVGERLVGAATVAHELHGGAAERRRNFARRRHRVRIGDDQIHFAEASRDDRATQLQHAVVRMRAEHFLELGQRSFGIVAFEFVELIGGGARIDGFFGMQLARDFVDDVFAAETAGAIEQPARVGPCSAGGRERLPQRQRVAIAPQIMEQRGQLAPVVGADVGRESGQSLVGQLRRLIEFALRQPEIGAQRPHRDRGQAPFGNRRQQRVGVVITLGGRKRFDRGCDCERKIARRNRVRPRDRAHQQLGRLLQIAGFVALAQRDREMIIDVVAAAHGRGAAQHVDSLGQAAARSQHDSILAQPVGILALEAMRLFDILARAVGVAQRDSRLRASNQRLHFARRLALGLRQRQRLRETSLGFADASLVAWRRRFGRTLAGHFELIEQNRLSQHEPRDRIIRQRGAGEARITLGAIVMRVEQRAARHHDRNFRIR